MRCVVCPMGARGYVTLRDVAITACVSPMSVSNLINARHGAMRPETRARIQAEIEGHGSGGAASRVIDSKTTSALV